MAEARRLLLPVSWAELHRNTRQLAWRLLERGPFTGIVAITRGGLIPAGIIARELDIRLIETFCIASYDHARPDATAGDAAILKGFTAADGGAGWLVIDELVDTGRTMRILRQHAPHALYASVYAKPLGKPLVDLYVTEVAQDTWIQFPWDTEIQYAKPLVER